jgi:hypothetical protein
MDATCAIRRLRLMTVLDDVGVDDAAVAADLRGLMAGMGVAARRAVVRHVYWRMPWVSSTALALALGGHDVVRDLAGRGPVVGSCAGCGHVRRARQRDDPPAGCAHCDGPIVWS